MRNKGAKLLGCMAGMAIIFGGTAPISGEAAAGFGWVRGEDGCLYWYEGGVRHGRMVLAGQHRRRKESGRQGRLSGFRRGPLRGP